MSRSYPNGRALAALLPSIELLEQSRVIVEGAIAEIGRLALETALALSAVDVAGEPRRPGIKAVCPPGQSTVEFQVLFASGCVAPWSFIVVPLGPTDEPVNGAIP